MLNQAVLEAMYSVPYVETYLDIVENLPDEIQKYLSKIRELNVSYESHVREVEALTNQHNASTDQSAKKRYLLKIQMALIAAQEIGDEKLAIMEQVGDTIESRTKPIDDIFYNLPSVVTSEHVKEKKEKDPEPHSAEHEDLTKEKEKSFSDKVNTSEPSPAPRKRTRRKIEKVETDNEVIEYSSTPLPRSSATIAVPKKPQGDLSSKKKKRKPRQPREQKKEASPPPDEDLEIDPDEPTYCICNRVSFGQMVMCDNDLCSLQWFHFSCVGVTNTPRGKWYCPKCRKVKSNAAQPKKQLVEKSEKHKEK